MSKFEVSSPKIERVDRVAVPQFTLPRKGQEALKDISKKSDCTLSSLMAAMVIHCLRDLGYEGIPDMQLRQRPKGKK